MRRCVHGWVWSKLWHLVEFGKTYFRLSYLLLLEFPVRLDFKFLKSAFHSSASLYFRSEFITIQTFQLHNVTLMDKLPLVSDSKLII